jgi:hypothetical protein
MTVFDTQSRGLQELHHHLAQLAAADLLHAIRHEVARPVSLIQYVPHCCLKLVCHLRVQVQERLKWVGGHRLEQLEKLKCITAAYKRSNSCVPGAAASRIDTSLRHSASSPWGWQHPGRRCLALSRAPAQDHAIISKAKQQHHGWRASTCGTPS